MRSKLVALLFVLLPVCANAATVQEIVTPKGITAWLVEEHSQPLLSVRFVFKNAGSAYDPKGKEGRALLTTELVTEGAGKLDADAFNNALESRAIKLEFDTDEDMFFASLDTLSEHRDMAFSLLSDALIRPHFDAAAIERVRSQGLAALKSLDQSPGYHMGRAFREAMYPGHPYAQPAHGTPGTVTALKRQDFVTYQTRYLARDNLVIAVVGDITGPELSTLLDTYFDALPAKSSPEHEVPEVEAKGGATILTDRDIPQTQILFGLQGIKRTDPAYFDAFVLNHIVGGGSLTTRLGKEIREQRGLAYSVSTSLDPMTKGALWTGSFATRNDQAATALDVMRATLKAIAENGVTDKELADAKQYLTGSFVLSLDTNGGLASFLISMQLNNLGKNYLDNRNSLVQAVTQESIKTMIKRLLDPSKLTVSMVGRPQGLDESQIVKHK